MTLLGLELYKKYCQSRSGVSTTCIPNLAHNTKSAAKIWNKVNKYFLKKVK